MFARFDVVDQLTALFAPTDAGHSAHLANGLRRAFLQVSSSRVLTRASWIATDEGMHFLPWFETGPAEDEFHATLFRRAEATSDPVFMTIRVLAEVVARRTLLDNGRVFQVVVVDFGSNFLQLSGGHDGGEHVTHQIQSPVLTTVGTLDLVAAFSQLLFSVIFHRINAFIQHAEFSLQSSKVMFLRVGVGV